MHFQRNKIQPINFNNLRIIDYTSDQNLSSSIAEVTVPPGTGHKVSWSTRSDKYYYVIEGCLSFSNDGKSSKLLKGDLAIVLKGEKFSYLNESDAEVKLLLVHTPGFKLEDERFEE